MPASREAIQAAVDSYRASLHDPPEARRSMPEIAADLDVLPQTLSQRVNTGYSDHNTGAVRLQALAPEEEGCLVDYIRRLSLLGLPPQPSLVLQTAEHLRNNRLLINTPFTGQSHPFPWLQLASKVPASVTPTLSPSGLVRLTRLASMARAQRS